MVKNLSAHGAAEPVLLPVSLGPRCTQPSDSAGRKTSHIIQS